MKEISLKIGEKRFKNKKYKNQNIDDSCVMKNRYESSKISPNC